MKKAVCCVCSKELPRMRRKFCSDRCASYHESKRKEYLVKYSLRSLFKPKNCLQCGKEFKPKSDRHKFCSKNCCIIVLNERRRKRREKIRKLGISNTVWNKQTKGFLGTSGSGNKNRKIGQYGHAIELDIPRVAVNTASFTPSDTEERMELKSKVEEYLAKGGKIAKYGAQPAVKEEDSISKWEVSEEEEKIAVEDYKEIDVYNGY